MEKSMTSVAWDYPSIRKEIESADISILSMVLIQLTGDASVMDTIRPYIDGPWDYMEHVPDETKREIRDRLAKVLSHRSEAEGSDVPEPSADLVHKMMEVCVGQQVPDEYVPMMLEQLAYGARTVAPKGWTSPDAAARAKDFHVAVIGAGISGIAAAIKLKQAGISYTVYEKNSHVGGTWYENRYPGCGVDTPNHFYSFSFEPNHDWSHYYSKRDEIQAYLEHCATKYGIREGIRFDTEVVSARYDDEKRTWSLVTKTGGREDHTEANAVIFAVGQLNRPSFPDIPGLADFSGDVVHTAQWKEGVDLRGRRVGMIGTGASGIQVGPTIAPEVERLVIFQRTPHWVSSNPNYHRAVSAGKKWALKHVPYYASWYRFQLSWAAADGIHSKLRVDPAWKTSDVSVNAEHEEIRQNLVARIKEQIGPDEELLKKVIPNFPPYGKRMLRDNYWYETLKRENVDLVTDSIARVTATGVETSTGTLYPLDTIILATGFKAGEMLASVDIRGRAGQALRDVWAGDNPKAYLGVTVPGFPNLFVMFGPNTNFAHGGSHIFSAEGQMRYILQCLTQLIERDCSSLECKQDVHDTYNQQVDEAHSRMVWGAPEGQQLVQKCSGQGLLDLTVSTVRPLEMDLAAQKRRL